MLKNLVGKKIRSYRVEKLIGKGQSGSVFQGVDEERNEKVAIKVYYNKMFKGFEKLKKQVQAQISVLQKCKNPNVVKYFDSFETKEYLFLVMEFCNEGSVDQFLQICDLNQQQAIVLLKQILNGFKGLHQILAVHRDLKTQNILLHNGVCKIADLGSCKQLGELSMTETIIGTPMISAPEVLERKPYGHEADIWSIGVVYYQMLYKRYPFQGTNHEELLHAMKSKQLDFSQKTISEDSKDFLKRCLTVEPPKRIKWKEIFNHPLVKQKTQIQLFSKNQLKNKVNIRQRKQSFLSRTSLDIFSKEMQLDTDSTLTPNSPSFQGSFSDYIASFDSIKFISTDQIEENFDNLYVKRRNKLIFFIRFVEPYLDRLQHLKINHSILGYLLAKKTCLDLRKFYDDLITKNVIFYGQKGFEEYCELDNYSNLQKKVYKDIQNVEALCEKHKNNIKHCNIEIKKELERNISEMSNFESLVRQNVVEYINLLKVELPEVSKQTKKTIIKVAQALKYWLSQLNPSSQQFESIISEVNYAELQKKLLTCRN